MRRLKSLGRRIRREEDGAVWVWFILITPVAIVLAALVLDVANWYVHQRHLQTQADAGAFAGADNFVFPCLSAENAGIEAAAQKYAGDPTVTHYNSQVNEPVSSPSNVHIVINSKNYWDKGGTPFSDGGEPCTTAFVDVKATDDKPALFFSKIFSGFGVDVHAHARVSLKKTSTLSGFLPLAVPDADPQAAGVMLVNEDDPLGGASLPLTVATLSFVDVETLNGRSVGKWWTPSPTASFTIPSTVKHVGVVVGLSDSPSWAPDRTKTIAQNCNQPLTQCAVVATTDATSTPTSWMGVDFIHTYQAAGGAPSPTNPVLRDVHLTKGTCADDSAPYFVLNPGSSGCTVSVSANIDIGGGAPGGLQVSVFGAGCKGGNPAGCALTRSGTTWTTNGAMPTISAEQGPLSLDINWKNGSSSGTFTQAQRVYSSDSSSDPIQYVQVSEGATVQANSLLTTDASGNPVSHSLSFVVGIQAPLRPSNQLVLLRLADGTGSHTQSLNCDSTNNFKVEMTNGCATPYQIDTAPPTCHAITPLDCVPQSTGQKTALQGALDAKFSPPPGNTCAVNHWDGNPADVSPKNDPNDPRRVSLIIAQFGAFNGNGGSPSTDVPVISFAYFYVVGWDSKSASCTKTSATDPTYNTPYNTPDPNAGAGDMWGYFIQALVTIPGSGGQQDCPIGQLPACSPELTN
jgi:hypothetical protein